MAYVKNIWVCGDPVTADKLNHLEDGVGDGNGYTCNPTFVDIFNGSVETMRAGHACISNTDIFAQNVSEPPESFRVIMDDKEFELYLSNHIGAGYAYGDCTGESLYNFSFDTYPCGIVLTFRSENEIALFVVTPNPGTYAVKIDRLTGVEVEVSPCFKAAVEKVIADSGGGFTTANITLINNSSESLSVSCPTIDGMGATSGGIYSCDAGQTLSLTAILPSDGEACHFMAEETEYHENLSNATSTGDVEIDGLYIGHDVRARVFGDGTITIS